MIRRLKVSRVAGPLRSLQSRWELRHLDDGPYREQRDDRAIRALMARVLTPNAGCVDIGANRGRILQMMVEQAPRGRHVALEPIPELAQALRERFPGVEVHQCAAGDQKAKASLTHVLSMSGWSTLRPPKDGFPGQTTEQIPVAVRRLDDLIPPERDVRFIKIDVEGAELQALRGAMMTLVRCRPWVVFEYGEGHSAPFGTTPAMIYDFLTTLCGFTVRSLHGLQGRLSRRGFIAACRHATATQYDRASQGNFLAGPA